MLKDESASMFPDDACENKLILELGVVLGSLYHTFLKTGPMFRCIEERMILFGWGQLHGGTFTGGVILT